MVDIQAGKKDSIVIIGIGNIGSRHLESLLKSSKSKVFVFDSSKKQINKIKKKYKNKLYYLKNLEDIKEEISLVIISTNADIRHKILYKVLERMNVKNVLLEKIVFQKLSYFQKFKKIIKKKKVNVFVNCPRRLLKIFEIIKFDYNFKKGKIYLNFNGSNWGLCSNTLHFIDIWFFLVSGNITNIKFNSNLDSKIFKSKRKNFFELKGKINFLSQEGHMLNVEDDISYKDYTMKIYFGNISYFLLFKNNRCYLKKTVNNNLEYKKYFNIPYQSSLTSIFFNMLKNKNYEKFTSFNESYLHHKIFFNSISKYFGKNYDMYKKIFPIT